MLHSVLGKTLHDQRRSLLTWAVSLALLVAMYVAVWPAVRDAPAMSDYLEQMPEPLRNLFATSGADMSTPSGYVQIELLSFMGPILLLIYAVVAGVSAVSGEEDRHTMDILLANPVSRARVVLEKAVAMAFGTFLLAAATGLAIVLEGPLTDMDVPAGKVAAAMLHMALLGVVFGALALALSAWTGRSGISWAVPAVVAVVAYVVNGLAPMVDWLEPFQKLSPFYQYVGHDPLRTGVDLGSVLVAVATAVALVLLAVVGFRRRDVRA